VGPFDVAVFKNVMIPMRDSVRLATDIYRPVTAGRILDRGLPTILIRTSIGKAHREWDPVTGYFPVRGYAVAIQDLRSRFESEGDGRYFHTCNPWEGDDGYDTIEWIAAQTWSNGKVGMMGSSHRAIVQTQAALHSPPHLAAICPEQGPTNIYAHEAREGGAMALHMYTAIYNHALDAAELKEDTAGMRRMVAGMAGMKDWLLNMPFSPGKIPLSVAPHLEQTFFNYYYRGEYDDWWSQECNDQSRYFDRHADVPALITGGWFDPFSSASAEYFRFMREHYRGPARLLIGPWGHGGMRLSRSFLGDVDFGAASVWGYPKHSETRLRWFDHWLKGERNGVPNDPPVEIFVMGGGTGRKDHRGHMQHGGHWRTEAAWPPERTEWHRFFLHESGLLSEGRPSRQAASRSFVFDPKKPVPTVGGAIASLFELAPLEGGALPDIPPYLERGAVYGPHMRPIVPWGPLDQREAPGMLKVSFPHRRLRDRSDVLVFETEPLPADLEVTGPIDVVLFVSSTALDTDFTAKLIDVYPPNEDYGDGYEMNLVDSIIRCRYRRSWTRPEPMRPDETYEVRIALPPTSNLFKAGHRIRLDISSSNFPRFDVNPNTGEPVGKHTTMVAAKNTVYTHGDYASYVDLPVIPQSDPR
jgi:putative CocE/NonD family hydrolase